jgi:hypothetical protein
LPIFIKLIEFIARIYLRPILLSNASMGSIPDIIYKTGSGAFFGKESILFRRDF